MKNPSGEEGQEMNKLKERLINECHVLIDEMNETKYIIMNDDRATVLKALSEVYKNLNMKEEEI